MARLVPDQREDVKALALSRMGSRFRIMSAQAYVLLDLRMGLPAFIFIFKRLSKVCDCDCDSCSKDLCFGSTWGVVLAGFSRFSLGFWASALFFSLMFLGLV